MSSISDLERQVRSFINAPRKHHALFQDTVEYYKLCSCLDVIGDTELAFHEYGSLSDQASPGLSYILVYGFLQALFLQQDAVRYLHEALHLPYRANPLLREIREIRNDAVGHPTKRDRPKGGTRFCSISRASISKRGFQVVARTPGEWPPTFRFVKLQDLVETQHQQLRRALETLLDALRREEMEHREKFKDDKLSAIFPPVIHYYFEKVYESTHGTNSSEYGTIHVDLIREIVEKFKAALAQRGIAGAYPAVAHQLASLEYPFAELSEYFAQKGNGRLNDKDADIFTSYLEHGVSKLQEMAAELDAEYASDPE